MNNTDKIKISLSVLLVVAGVAGYYAFARQLGDFRVVSVVLGLLLAAGVFLSSDLGKTFLVYVKESIKEGKKVAWPTKNDTMKMTLVVFVFVAILAIFLTVVDKLWEWLVYGQILGGQ